MNRRDLFRVSALAFASGTYRRADAAPLADTADEMIHKYLTAETKRISEKFMDGATTRAAWEKVRPRLKSEFLYMLGLDPLPEKTPLKATTTGTLERGDVIIEKLHYQSKPGLYVTANLYKPKTLPKDAKLPAILYACGHSNKGRDGNKSAYQTHPMWFASNGYVCLIVDTLQLGEIAGKHHGTYNLNRFWWHSRGYTPAGVECWNGIRGIDYLCSLPYVDADRIGVTGRSGGGAATNWIIGADERVKVAVPVSGVSDLECYVTDKVINGHCDCMFFHNVYQWEWTTGLALFAPKPMLFANSDNDGIFPMTGNKRVIARLRKCYDMLGAKDNVDEHVAKGKHEDSPDLQLASFAFFHKHLKGDNTPVKAIDSPKIEGKDLRVFPEDKDIPKDAINATADETFVPIAKVDVPNEKNFKEWKAGLVKQLREKVFKGTGPRGEGWVESKKDGEWLSVKSEQGLQVPAYIKDIKDEAEFSSMLVVLNEGEDHAKELAKWEKQFPNESRYAVLYPRGIGKTSWTRKNPPNTVERSLVLIGQTVDSGRMFDVMMTSVSLSGLAKPQNRVVGRGVAGVIAAYAGLFVEGKPERFIHEVVIVDPPTSHRDGPHFLNVMRVMDIPEALGLLAPDIKLTLVGKNAKDKAFDRTAAIYAAAGAKDKFKRE